MNNILLHHNTNKVFWRKRSICK